MFSIHVKTIDHLNLKILVFPRHTACLKIGISKVQDFENFEFSQIQMYVETDAFTLSLLLESEVSSLIWASTQQNLSSGFLKKRDSNQSPQLQRLARKLKFGL